MLSAQANYGVLHNRRSRRRTRFTDTQQANVPAEILPYRMSMPRNREAVIEGIHTHVWL